MLNLGNRIVRVLFAICLPCAGVIMLGRGLCRVIGLNTIFNTSRALRHYTTQTAFSATLVKDALKEGRDFLSTFQRNNTGSVIHATDAFSTRVVLSHVLGLGTSLVDEGDNIMLNKQQLANYEGLLGRVAKGEPLQYVIGEWSFSDINLFVSPAVLIPRADSEVVIEAIEEKFGDKSKKLTVVDIGVGSGCLLLATLKNYPNARGIGIDISSEALAVTKKNAEKLGVIERINLVCIPMQDLLLSLQKGDTTTVSKEVIDAISKADILISNPPYIKTDDILTLQKEVRDYEPFIALDGGEDGLKFYRILTDIFNIILGNNARSRAFFEIGFTYGQSADVTNILEKEKRIRVETIHKDYSSIDRCIVASNNVQ